MINIIKKLLDFIYDKKCYFCSSSKENTIFCSECLNTIDFLPFEPVSNINGVDIFAVTYYKDVVQKLIRAVKYHNKKELADFQADIMFNYWKHINLKDKKYFVIPVPMFFSKARNRKYNHMDLVCEHFCKLTGFEYKSKSIIRNRETKAQYNLSKKQREENLKDAFSLIDKNLNQPILLMDDISTTGTTLKEIINLFHKNNIYDITCFVTAIPQHTTSAE